MKRGDPATVCVGGTLLQGEYLGRGRHAKAYRVRYGGPFPDSVFLLVDEDDSMKEALARWCDDVPHLPQIKEYDQNVRSRGGKYYNLYAMPFYPDIRAVNKEAWRILKILYDAREKLLDTKYTSGVFPVYGHEDRKPVGQWGSYLSQDVIDDTRGRVPETVTDALTELMNAGRNYGGGVTFEFGKRNVGVDAEGRIVFRDILLDWNKMAQEIRKKIRGRY